MVEVGIYGVRGSMATPKKEFMEFGGNTSSYTIRTDENTLIFLDAGSGIMYASKELDDIADNVVLAISHVHADHTMGLGMSGVAFLSFNPNYKNKKVQLVGPKGVLEGLQQFYDGSKSWPVRATNNDIEEWEGPTLAGVDFGGLEELVGGDSMIIDSSTKLEVLKGNHPVKGGVNLYKISTGNSIIVYATDNEFDYLGDKSPNPNAKRFKEEYIRFIKDADILIADAQYTKEEYSNVHGFGHSYDTQIIDLAEKGNVSKVLLSHINPKHTDEIVFSRERNIDEYITSKGYNLKAKFAREGSKINL